MYVMFLLNWVILLWFERSLTALGGGSEVSQASLVWKWELGRENGFAITEKEKDGVSKAGKQKVPLSEPSLLLLLGVVSMVSVPAAAAVEIAPVSASGASLLPSPSSVTVSSASFAPGASSGPSQELVPICFCLDLVLLASYSSQLKKRYSYSSAAPPGLIEMILFRVQQWRFFFLNV